MASPQRWSLPDEAPDLSRKIVDRKPLGQHFHAGIEVAGPSDGVLGASGNEQDLESRPEGSRRICYLPDLHAARRAAVCDQQVEAAVGLQQPETRPAVPRRDARSPGSGDRRGIENQGAALGEIRDDRHVLLEVRRRAMRRHRFMADVEFVEHEAGRVA